MDSVRPFSLRFLSAAGSVHVDLVLWGSLVAGLSLLSGCLNLDVVPIASKSEDTGLEDGGVEDADSEDAGREDAGPEDAGTRGNCADDPLVGAWVNGDCVLEFFSNGRYSDCWLFPASGFASDWSLLDDGRYYFGRSSLGSPSGECLGQATFDEDCNSVSLSLTCGYAGQVLELVRR